MPFNTTLKIWNCLSDGICTRTLHQPSDHVTCLAAPKNGNVVVSGGLGAGVFIWDLEAAVPVSISTEVTENDNSIMGICSTNPGLAMTSLHSVSSNKSIPSQTAQFIGYALINAKGHKESVYALAMNDSGSVLVSGGTEEVYFGSFFFASSSRSPRYILEVFSLHHLLDHLG